jgi:hypothetical protein
MPSNRLLAHMEREGNLLEEYKAIKDGGRTIFLIDGVEWYVHAITKSYTDKEPTDETVMVHYAPYHTPVANCNMWRYDMFIKKYGKSIAETLQA